MNRLSRQAKRAKMSSVSPKNAAECHDKNRAANAALFLQTADYMYTIGGGTPYKPE